MVARLSCVQIASVSRELRHMLDHCQEYPQPCAYVSPPLVRSQLCVGSLVYLALLLSWKMSVTGRSAANLWRRMARIAHARLAAGDGPDPGGGGGGGVVTIGCGGGGCGGRTQIALARVASGEDCKRIASLGWRGSWLRSLGAKTGPVLTALSGYCPCRVDISDGAAAASKERIIICYM